MVEEMRGHIHSIDRICAALEPGFELSPREPGPYLHRWHLDLALLPTEEALIAAGELPEVGVRFSGRRR
jgi:hypothetical protein